jgi:hypothetical protein
MFHVHVMLVLVWDIDGITWRWRNFYLLTSQCIGSMILSTFVLAWKTQLSLTIRIVCNDTPAYTLKISRIRPVEAEFLLLECR